MKTRLYFLFLFLITTIAGSCNKEYNGNREGGRIHRISQESEGIIQYVFEFSYNKDGTVNQILLFDQTSYSKLYLYSHTPNTTTRRYQNEEGKIFDIDSAVLNAAGKPLENYISRNRKWQLEKRLIYNGNGELAQGQIVRNNNPDSISSFVYYHQDGDLVRIEDKIDGDQVYGVLYR